MYKKRTTVVCYGASVTAQKNEGGYFYHLKKLCDATDIDLHNLSFGGSHFDFAGYGFISLLLELKPDIVILDWLTPSSKNIDDMKLESFNNSLIEAGIKPVWVHFPRKDDLSCQRLCYSKIKKLANLSNSVFLDILEAVPFFHKNAEIYLRDIVHTTELGAELYAKTLFHLLEKRDKIPDCKISGYIKKNLPIIYKIDKVVDHKNSIQLNIKNNNSKNIEVLVDCEIGPNTPYIEIIINKENDTLSKIVNPIDPWCYYTRNMILPSITFNMEKGDYNLILKTTLGDPFTKVNLLKPVKIERKVERFIKIKKIIIS